MKMVKIVGVQKPGRWQFLTNELCIMLMRVVSLPKNSYSSIHQKRGQATFYPVSPEKQASQMPLEPLTHLAEYYRYGENDHFLCKRGKSFSF